MKRLFISGIPGCGKSSFGRWLQASHGFTHVDMEHDGLDKHGLRSSWRGYELGADRRSFPAAIERIATPVVLDWGFPLSRINLVRQIQADGFSMCWFDGDRSTARSLFERRNTVSLAAFDAQMNDISAHWGEISALFSTNVFHVVLPDGTRLTDQAMYSQIAQRASV